MSINKLNTELASRRRLADVAKPAAAPPLLTKPTATFKTTNSVVYGKRIRLKEDKKPQKPKPQKQQEQEFVEEMDSDEETDSKTTDNKPVTTIDTTEKSESIDKSVTIDKTESIENIGVDKEVIKIEKPVEKDDKEAKEVKRTFGPMRPPENYVVPENYFNQESDRDLPEISEE